MSLLVLVVTLNDRSRDCADPRMLNLHLSLELPESESAEFRQEVQQVVVAGWHSEINVKVLAHAIWIFLFFCSDLSVQPMAVVQLTGMRGS